MAGSARSPKLYEELALCDAQVSGRQEAAVGAGRPADAGRRRLVGGALLLAVWAALFLPRLRTNPNWYGDEGEWLEMSWTLIHGQPRVGPIVNDFVFPYHYPALYQGINGALLRLFGYDILVSRAAGAVTALTAAGILAWIGSRLRDREFGLLCALSFLIYDEAVMNFRWVRSHPMAGTLALACIGFLIRYVQEKRWRDAALAGLMCSLATATNYFTYPLIGAVVLTVALVHPAAVAPIGSGGVLARWAIPRRARRAALAGALACSYAGLFVVWYVMAHPGGWERLLAQVARLSSLATNEVRPTWVGELRRFAGNVWTLGFRTPTHGPPPDWSGRDAWLMIAMSGFLFLPVRDWRLRIGLPLWLLLSMAGVFAKLNNVSFYFYPATTFLPLMAVGFAGVLVWAGAGTMRLAGRAVTAPASIRFLPALIALAVFGVSSLQGAWGHFHSKIDLWTQRSLVADAEAATAYVNERTTDDDFVLVPKQIYALVETPRKSMLSLCLAYEGKTTAAWPVPIPRELFWFDCRLENAKYLVLAYGRDANGQLYGIDAVYTLGLEGMSELIRAVQEERWPVALQRGEYMVLANPRFAGSESR